MPTLRHRVPRYCHHKQSGQARVTINGKTHYLGPHGSPASRERYDALISRYLARQRRAELGMTISQLMALFWRYAKVRYGKRGKGKWGAAINYRPILRLLREMYGTTLVSDFGPKALTTVREAMINEGLSRGYINDQIARLRGAFRWAVSEEMIPVEVYQRLMTLDGLRKGATGARETPQVEPVLDSLVDATLPFMTPTVADMVRFQRLTGCRPGEVVRIRPGDVDRWSGDVWRIRFDEHKTAHHGKRRTIYVGPKAQAILTPRLLKPADAYCFHSINLRRCYHVDSYRVAIQRACRRAGVQIWSPNQLRHTAGTEVRQAFGAEHAQAILGHSNLKVTEIYAERSEARAIEVARRLG